MYQTFNKPIRSYSLPKLQSKKLTQSKLFRNNDELQKTKKMFMLRLEAKDQPKNNQDQNDKSVASKSFIQFPKQFTQQGFISFKSINKNQSEEIFSELKQMRSKSTLLMPHVKAQIMLNKAAHQKIRIANELRLQQQKEYVAKRMKQLTPVSMKKQIKIKQKLKNKTKNVKKITLSLNYKIYQQNLHCWKPYVDYDSMAVAIKQQIYFIGGRKSTPPVVFNQIQSKWKQLPEIPSMKCFGESNPTVIENRIFCFGGYDYFQQGFSMITNTLKIFDTKKLTFEVEQFSQVKTPLRAFHSQCVYGKFLIISGGIDKNSKLFDNFMNYNYQKKYWSQVTIQKMPQKLKLGFAKHQTIALFHKRQNYSIYEEEPIIQKDEGLSEQGIYIFGGEDSNGELSSTMHIMRLGQPAIVISELQIAGNAPIARRNTTMVHHKEYLIIHGGRNDEMKPSILNSIHFLNLRTLNWIRIGGEKPPYRCSHALTVVNDQIVILGGKGLQGLNKEVFVMPYQEVIQYL